MTLSRRQWLAGASSLVGAAALVMSVGGARKMFRSRASTQPPRGREVPPVASSGEQALK